MNTRKLANTLLLSSVLCCFGACHEHRPVDPCQETTIDWPKEGERLPIPKSWLWHVGASGQAKPGGLKARYFDNRLDPLFEIACEGPLIHGYSNLPDFSAKNSPENGRGLLLIADLIPQYQGSYNRLWADRLTPLDQFEEVLSGWLVVPLSGCYEVTASIDDYIKLSLNGQTVISWDSSNAHGEARAALRLQEGERYEIDVLYKNRLGSAFLHLYYELTDCASVEPPPSRRTVNAEDIIAQIRRADEVTLYNSDIMGGFDLTNIGQVESRITITNSTFLGPVIFGDERWDRRADQPARFEKPVDFSGSTFAFRRNVFEGAEFLDSASFRDVVFEGYASFTNATFSGQVSFFSSQFLLGGEFVGTRFEEEADFRNIDWLRMAPFTGSVFQGPSTFSGSRFDGALYLDRASFIGDVSFRGSSLTRGIVLNDFRSEGSLRLPDGELSRVVENLKGAGFPDEVVRSTLIELEKNYRESERVWEANRVAASRFWLELQEQPWWFRWLLSIFLGLPSNFGTAPLRLLLVVALIFAIPRTILWHISWSLKEAQVPEYDTLWRRVSLGEGSLVFMKWVLSANAVLCIVHLVDTRVLSIYRLFAPWR